MHRATIVAWVLACLVATGCGGVDPDLGAPGGAVGKADTHVDKALGQVPGCCEKKVGGRWIQDEALLKFNGDPADCIGDRRRWNDDCQVRANVLVFPGCEDNDVFNVNILLNGERASCDEFTEYKEFSERQLQDNMIQLLVKQAHGKGWPDVNRRTYKVRDPDRPIKDEDINPATLFFLVLCGEKVDVYPDDGEAFGGIFEADQGQTRIHVPTSGSFTLSAAHRRVSWRHAYYEVVVDEPIVDGKVADRLVLDGDGPYTPVPAVICSPPESICDTSY